MRSKTRPLGLGVGELSAEFISEIDGSAFGVQFACPGNVFENSDDGGFFFEPLDRAATELSREQLQQYKGFLELPL